MYKIDRTNSFDLKVKFRYASHIKKIGTLVMMTLGNETPRRLSEVFNMYTNVEEGFIRTRILLKRHVNRGQLPENVRMPENSIMG